MKNRVKSEEQILMQETEVTEQNKVNVNQV